MVITKLPITKKITFNTSVFRYTICTLVTNYTEYQKMLESFVFAGFTDFICEFLYIDNIEKNTFDAYKGINQFLQHSQGEFIIICHQDVLLNIDNIEDLERQILEIEALDQNWAVLSNAGGLENNLYQKIATLVVYPDGFLEASGKLPQKVCSVDENFILIKKSTNLALSSNLSGFHLYGLDLCLIAELLGFNAYVINFKLTHKSYGNADENYYVLLEKLIDKYLNFFRSRHIITTITDFQLSPFIVRRWIFNIKWFKKIIRKFYKIRSFKK